MIQRIVDSGFDGYFVLPSNPVDIMSYVVKRVSNFPKNKIILTPVHLQFVRVTILRLVNHHVHQ
jgi:L-lactate dehydrogenase